MTNDDDQDIEPGWGGMAILLWPIRFYYEIKVWLHDKRHPDQSEEI